jgi:signal transduction histidine kinase/putative methionine-R-sulfoxide reductase with GAF domain
MAEIAHEEAGSLAERRELRSVAQLRFLHTLAPRLNALDDVSAIGEAITAELQTLIDYHNCRIYLLQRDGRTLVPIVFRGSLGEYHGETYEELITQVGEGFTGRAAETGQTYYSPDALRDDVGVQIEGTPEIEESILCVPMKVGDRVTGVIVLSNLGIDQFEEDDVRLLEVLSSHAAVAFENARLLQQEREAAETASALLGLSQALTGAHDTTTVLDRAVAALPLMIDTSVVVAYVHDREAGLFRAVAYRGVDPDRAVPDVPSEIATPLLASLTEPYVIPAETAAAVPAELWIVEGPRAALVIPLGRRPEAFAAIVAVAPDADSTFGEREVALGHGIGDIVSLALGSAKRVHELERFHELVESIDAIFWEADPETFDFAFLSRRAALVLGEPDDPSAAPSAWGEHIHPGDRGAAIAALRGVLATPGDDVSLEYRALGDTRSPLWLRDIVHVGTDASGERQLRGLIVDVTERKRAEEALKRSEQKYSEAFRREREATQQLRALDDMKNTFLEAVSHDLRTPLTSILGSALTLEQAGLEIPRDDALDLLRRIAANARKLERLLSDLLDLDRLQRGIVSPQRRPTDVGALVAQSVEESELLGGRQIELATEGLVVNVDAAKVERIVENLLANAARHTPAGTPLWVRVTGERGGGVTIAVDDAGPGVPDEMKDAVFEAFRQGDGGPNPSPGVGVGLSLVARFAELHGGSAWVEDRPGGGASFRVYLPDAP